MKKKTSDKKKTKKTQMKEIKLRPTTDEGDLKIKLRKMTEFLESGDSVKVTIRFMGREMAYGRDRSFQELAAELQNRVETELAEVGNVESRGKMEGRQLIMVIAPKKQK